MLKREIEQSLFDRDKAVREAHELRYVAVFPVWEMSRIPRNLSKNSTFLLLLFCREKLGGGGKVTSDYGDLGKHSSKGGRFDADKHKKDR